MKCYNYRGLIGSLNYLANTSRPDILFAPRSLSRFVQNPGRQHWNEAKHVLQYLKCTRNSKLIYEKANEIRIVGYTDADEILENHLEATVFSKRYFRCC